MRQIIKLVGWCAALLLPTQLHAADWVYVDLGEVIVTGNPTVGYKYLPGAEDFLKALREHGYKTAALSNIPESWGATCPAKFSTFRDFVQSHWVGERPFDWLAFDAVVTPPFDRYRKPHSYMFLTALKNACTGRALYIGENESEVDTARHEGFAAFHKASAATALPSLEGVATLIEAEFTFAHPPECDFAPLFQRVLLPGDEAVVGCVTAPFLEGL